MSTPSDSALTHADRLRMIASWYPEHAHDLEESAALLEAAALSAIPQPVRELEDAREAVIEAARRLREALALGIIYFSPLT